MSVGTGITSAKGSTYGTLNGVCRLLRPRARCAAQRAFTARFRLQVRTMSGLGEVNLLTIEQQPPLVACNIHW